MDIFRNESSVAPISLKISAASLVVGKSLASFSAFTTMVFVVLGSYFNEVADLIFTTNKILLTSNGILILLINARQRYIRSMRAARAAHRQSVIRSLELVSISSNQISSSSSLSSSLSNELRSNNADSEALDNNNHIDPTRQSTIVINRVNSALLSWLCIDVIDITAILGFCILFVTINSPVVLSFSVFVVIARLFEVLTVLWFCVQIGLFDRSQRYDLPPTIDINESVKSYPAEGIIGSTTRRPTILMPGTTIPNNRCICCRVKLIASEFRKCDKCLYSLDQDVENSGRGERRLGSSLSSIASYYSSQSNQDQLSGSELQSFSHGGSGGELMEIGSPTRRRPHNHHMSNML